MKVLIVEDDVELSNLVKKGLNNYGYCCDLANDGEEGLYLGESGNFDVIILDINLPKLDGITVCRTLRDRGIITPVIMLTARTDTDDKVLGFDSGADDYIGKPFEFKELRARLHALIRRTYNKPTNVLLLGGLSINTKNKKVMYGTEEIDLTHREYDILEMLCFNSPNFVSSEEIIEHIWGEDDCMFSNVIRVHISNLRRKVKNGKGESLIESYKGKGYRIC